MTDLPAFCPKCDLIFNSTMGLTNSGVKVVGIHIPCPRCGATAKIPDGEYLDNAGVLHLLAAPEVSVNQLKRLQRLLLQAHETSKTIEELTLDIEREVPELLPVMALLRKHGGAIGWLITTALTAAGLALQLKTVDPMSETQMARAVQRGMEAAAARRDSERPSQPAPPAAEGSLNDLPPSSSSFVPTSRS